MSLNLAPLILLDPVDISSFVVTRVRGKGEGSKKPEMSIGKVDQTDEDQERKVEERECHHNSERLLGER